MCLHFDERDINTILVKLANLHWRGDIFRWSTA
jgi:hypothetical protein